MSHHTPGPWEICEFAKTDIFTGLRYHDVFAGYGYGDIIARVFSVRKPLVSDVDADANLIAAAPELLKALKALEYKDNHGRFCDHADYPNDQCPRCKAASDAIAKAEGRHGMV